MKNCRHAAWFWLVTLSAVPVACYSSQPAEALDREWLVSSLLPGSRLADRNLFDLTFERGGPSGVKKIWIASSDGLYAYDGYQWQRYTKENGLPSNFIRCVLLTRAGTLWVGTSEGAGVFDGKSFSRHGSDQGLAGKNVRRIIEDPDGGLWFCSDSWPFETGPGGLSRFRDGQWRSWHASDGLPSDYVVNFFRSSAGRQFVATSAGLAELQGDRWRLSLQSPVGARWNWGSASFAETPRFGLMVSTGEQVFLQKNNRWRAFTNVLRHEHGISATSDGKIVACGSKSPHQRVFLEWTGNDWRPVSAVFPVTHDYVEGVREGPDGSIYAVGFDCLQRWRRRGSEWRAFLGTPNPLFMDAGGAVWSMDQRGFFAFQNGRWKNLAAPYRGLIRTATGVLAWNAHKLSHRSSGDRSAQWTINDVDFTHEQVDLDREGNVWVFGHDRNGAQRLRRYLAGRWTAVAIPECRWVRATPDRASGIWYLAQTVEGQTSLLRIDRDLQVKSYPVPSRVISRYSNSIYADRHGYVWLFGDTGLYSWRTDKPSWTRISDLPGQNVIGCLERADEVWFAVDGTLGGRSGLASFIDGSWKKFNTDPLSSWSIAGDGRLLFGSKGKFYVVPSDGDRLPVPVRLPEQEQVIGILEDRDHTFWVGTSQGTFLFRPSRLPPQTTFVSFDRQVIEGNTYRARVRSVQMFNLPAASSFAYSWSVDNAAWSPFDSRAERTFQSRRLALGTHLLRVRAPLGLRPHSHKK